jgi:hypothetical protein
MNLRKLRRMTAAIPRNIEKKNGTATETPEQALLREMKEARTQLPEAVKAKADAPTVTALQRQVDAIDIKLAERHATGIPEKSLLSFLEEDEGLQKFMRDRPRGSYSLNLDAKQAARLMERKTAIDSVAVGSATSGVLQIERPESSLSPASD